MKWQAISSHHSRWGWHAVILEADDDDWRVNLCSTRNGAIFYSQGELTQGVLKARTPGDSEGQGSLACCSPWGRRELEATEQQRAKDRASHGEGPTDSSWPHQHGPSSRRHLGAQRGLDGRHGRACQPKREQRTRHGLVWFSRAVSPRKRPAFLKGIHLFVEKYKI